MTGDPVHPVILVVVDRGPGALAAVRWAAREAATRGGAVRLVATARHRIGRPFTDAVRVASATAPETPVELCGPDAAARPRRRLAGSAAADLLVVGGRRWRRVWSLTAAPGRRTAQCPVVVVPQGCGLPDPALPVVVGVDGTAASAAAVEHAFAAADVRGAPVLAVHTWWDRVLDSGPADLRDWARIAAEEEAVLGEQVAGPAAAHPAVVVQRVSSCGSATRALVELSRSAQLVVIGTHGHGRLGAHLVDSAGYGLVRAGGCPVVIVPAGARAPRCSVGGDRRG